MEIKPLLAQLGLGEKEILVYLSLLSGGPASVRKIAKEADVGRSAIDGALSGLKQLGLVGMFQKHKKAFFFAEEPDKFLDVIEQRERSVAALKRDAAELIPELKSLHKRGAAPAIRYYQGKKGVAIALRDILHAMSEQSEKLIRSFADASAQRYLSKDFSFFAKERIARRLRLRMIARGKGGADESLCERRTFPTDSRSPAVSFIYGSKASFLSIEDEAAPFAVIMDDKHIAEAERLFFDQLWQALETPGLCGT